MATIKVLARAPLRRDVRLRFVREDGSEAFSEPLTGPAAMALAARFGRQIHCEIVPNTRSLAMRIEEQGQGVSAVLAVGLATVAAQSTVAAAECTDPDCPHCRAIEHAFRELAAPVVIHEGPVREGPPPGCDCDSGAAPASFTVQIGPFVDEAGADEPTERSIEPPAHEACTCTVCTAALAGRAAALVLALIGAAALVSWLTR